MANNRIPDITIENTRLMFRNLGGKPDKFNPQGGKRTVGIPLSPEDAERMRRDGWNVKTLQPRANPEDPTDVSPAQDWIEVTASYKVAPPRIFTIGSRGRRPLSEETVETVDYINIQPNGVDVILSPYQWDVNGTTGIKAYIRTMYIKVDEDDLDLKYSDIADEPGVDGAF